MSARENCPNCGAPLLVEHGRCAYCQVPLAAPSAHGGPLSPPPDVEPTGSPLAPFAMDIQEVSHVDGVGTVVTGRIESGSIRPGDKLVVDKLDGPLHATCGGVQMFDHDLVVAQAGDLVELLLTGVDRDDLAFGDQLRTATHHI